MCSVANTSCAVVLTQADFCCCSIGSDCERLGDRYKFTFETIEWASVFMFTLEYIMRLWACVEDPDTAKRGAFWGRIRYALTFYPLVDMLSILPNWISFCSWTVDWLIPGSQYIESPNFTTAGRIVRLVRIFKVRLPAPLPCLLHVTHRRQSVMVAASCPRHAKLAWRQPNVIQSCIYRTSRLANRGGSGMQTDKYLNAFSLLADVLWDNRILLLATSFYSMMMWVIAATLLFYTEQNNHASEMGDHFQSIPLSMFPTLLMLTGEYPLSDFTPLGQVVAGFVAIVAVAIFAVPTSILGSGFMKAVQQAQHREFTVEA